MTITPVALGSNIQTAINAGLAGDTYTFASGIYYGQKIAPKVGDFYVGAPGGGTILSGACLISTWVNVSANWNRATVGTTDIGGSAAFPSPNSLWRGTATISGTTLTIVTTTSGAFSTSSGAGAALYGNGVTAATSVVSGSGSTWTITPSQTVSTTTNMLLCDMHNETTANGSAANDPLAWWSEELFVDGARYTRIQPPGTVVAPGAGQWFFDLSNNTVNINLASPGTHTIEYGQTIQMINAGSGTSFTMMNLTVEKYGGDGQGAITTYPDASITLINITARFNTFAGVNIGGNGFLGVYGGHYTDNGECGIMGSPTKGYVIGAELARNNPTKRFSVAWQAAGIKFTSGHDCAVLACNAHDNGGPGIWYDIGFTRCVIGNNTVSNNAGPGVMFEISSGAKIFGNVISGSGPDVGTAGCAIFLSNSSNAEVYNNTCTVKPGNTTRVGGGICALNATGRGSSATVAAAVITASISTNVLTVTATSATIQVGQLPMGPGIFLGTYIVKQLTGTVGSTGTYQLSAPQTTIASQTFYAMVENNNVLCEARNLSIHHNTITYLDAAGATDGIGVDVAMIGGSNNYFDFNNYYTPNSTGTFWKRANDVAVATSYTWAAYQTAGFEPNGTNVVGIAPSLLPATYPSARFPKSFGAVTPSALAVSSVTTGGVAVTAIAASGRMAGGWIKNPENATANLGINEIGTAIGTSSSGSTVFIAPGVTWYLSPSANAVSVISADGSHGFSGISLS